MPALSQLKTPGVYVDEVSLLPPSVVQVATAVPAFIGYTEIAENGQGQDLTLEPTEIASMADFRAYFGGAPPVEIKTLDLDLNMNVKSVKFEKQLYLHDSLRLYFGNGGGRCYLISIGDFTAGANLSRAQFEEGLKALETEDDPTLILFPDAVSLDASDLFDLQKTALAQCQRLKDRFVICDLEKGKPIREAAESFRGGIGMNALSYGAAYGPYLEARLDHNITYRNLEGKLTFSGQRIDLSRLLDEGDKDAEAALTALKGAMADVNALAEIATDEGLAGDLAGDLTAKFQTLSNALTAALLTARGTPDEQNTAAAVTATGNLLDHLYARLNAFADVPAAPASVLTDKEGFVAHDLRDAIKNVLRRRLLDFNKLVVGGAARIDAGADLAAKFTARQWTAAEWDDGGSAFDPALAGDEASYPADTGALADEPLRLAQIENMEFLADEVQELFGFIHSTIVGTSAQAEAIEATYHAALLESAPPLRNIITATTRQETVVPPSGAIAGLYASVDALQGVHTAPANRSLGGGIIAPVEKITDAEQETLNVHESGKSINAIRSFVNRGVLVWGARTLDGNSNEWRYVNVRRFFMMVEESAKKASARFVFSRNTRSTWVRVKAMLENFLRTQFEAGALMGSVPEEAFFVKVGVPDTMSEIDRLEGRMIVEIGLAVARPAEFIVLRFSHHLPS